MAAPESELIIIPDEELERLAAQNGPTSAEAQVLAQLTSQRAQDHQVYAFRAGDQYVTGPMPEVAESVDASIELVDALKRTREE